MTLPALVCLVLSLCSLVGHAGTFSGYTQTTTGQTNDLLLLDQTNNGAGTFTTKTLTVSNLFKSPAALQQVNANAAVTNGASIVGLAVKYLSRDFGVTGSGVETAKLQAAMFAKWPVVVDINFTSGPVLFTNQTCLLGDGLHHAHFDPAATGFMISGLTNMTNVILQGLIGDGDSVAFTGSGFSVCWQSTGATNVIQTVSASRSFIQIANAQTNSICSGNAAYGFSDTCFNFIPNLGATPQPGVPPIQCNFNRAANSWQAFNFAADAEYMECVGLTAENVGRAFVINAGNIAIDAFLVTASGVGAWVPPGSNPAHGRLHGVFNHDFNPITCFGFNNGEDFDNCEFLGGGYILLTNCTGVNLNHPFMSSITTIVCDGGGGGTAGVNKMFSCSALGYPVIQTLNGGNFVHDGIHNLGAPGTLTNGFAINWTNNVIASKNLNVGINNPSLSFTLGVWDSTDAGETTPQFYVDAPGNVNWFGRNSSTSGKNTASRFVDRGGNVIFNVDPGNSKIATALPVAVNKNAPSGSSQLDVNGQALLGSVTVSNGITLQGGANAFIGTGVLTAGKATVANTTVDANTIIFVTQSIPAGGVINGGSPGFLWVSNTPSVGFTVFSANNADTNSFNWHFFKFQ